MDENMTNVERKQEILSAEENTLSSVSNNNDNVEEEKRNKNKKIGIIAAIAAVVIILLAIIAGGGDNSEQEFYDIVSETQELLDDYADDIYRCWYDYVYEDEYSSVNAALAAAYAMNSSNIKTIESNNNEIKELYSKVKDGKLKDEIKAVMQAYNEYYSFVMEVSGSYNSFSAGKETNKKALANALKNLSFELE